MTQIDNRFNIGDTVWIIYQNKIKETKVESITITIVKPGVEYVGGAEPIRAVDTTQIVYSCLADTQPLHTYIYHQFKQKDVYATQDEVVRAITRKL